MQKIRVSHYISILLLSLFSSVSLAQHVAVEDVNYGNGNIVTESSGNGSPADACTGLARYTQKDAVPGLNIWQCINGHMRVQGGAAPTSVAHATTADSATNATNASNAANANQINGIAITGTPVAGYIPTATGPTTAVWQSPSTFGGGSGPTTAGQNVLISGSGTTGSPYVVALPNTLTIPYAPFPSGNSHLGYSSPTQTASNGTLTFTVSDPTTQWSNLGTGGAGFVGTSLVQTIYTQNNSGFLNQIGSGVQLLDYAQGNNQSGHWSGDHLHMDIETVLHRGIAQNHSSVVTMTGIGDKATFLYLYSRVFGGIHAYSDEATQVMAMQFFQQGYLYGTLSSIGSAAVAYNSTVTYTPGNMVSQGGLTYMAVATTLGNSPTSTTYWTPVNATLFSTTGITCSAPDGMGCSVPSAGYFFNDGGLLFDKSQPFLSGASISTEQWVNGVLTASLTGGTVAPSTAWGTAGGGACGSTQDENIQNYFPTTCVVTLGGGTTGYFSPGLAAGDGPFASVMLITSPAPTAYSSVTAYSVGDNVLQGGVVYTATAATTGNAPPNTLYWSGNSQTITFLNPHRWDQSPVQNFLQGGPIGNCIVENSLLNLWPMCWLTLGGIQGVASATVTTGTSPTNGTYIVNATSGTGSLSIYVNGSNATATVLNAGYYTTPPTFAPPSGLGTGATISATVANMVVYGECFTGICNGGGNGTMSDIKPNPGPITLFPAAEIIGTNGGSSTQAVVAINTMSAVAGDVVVGAPDTEVAIDPVKVYFGQDTPRNNAFANFGLDLEDYGTQPPYAMLGLFGLHGDTVVTPSMIYNMTNVTDMILSGYRPANGGAIVHFTFPYNGANFTGVYGLLHDYGVNIDVTPGVPGLITFQSPISVPGITFTNGTTVNGGTGGLSYFPTSANTAVSGDLVTANSTFGLTDSNWNILSPLASANSSYLVAPGSLREFFGSVVDGQGLFSYNSYYGTNGWQYDRHGGSAQVRFMGCPGTGYGAFNVQLAPYGDAGASISGQDGINNLISACVSINAGPSGGNQIEQMALNAGSTFGNNAVLSINPSMTVDNFATMQLTTNFVGNKGLVLQGMNGQTGNMLEVQSYLGVPLVTFSATGSGTFTSFLAAAYLENSATQTSVNCSGGGTAVFSQPDQGPSAKEVLVTLDTCVGTATYTYPTGFLVTPTPDGLSALTSTVTGVSTTNVTITGSTTTGTLKLIGY